MYWSQLCIAADKKVFGKRKKYLDVKWNVKTKEVKAKRAASWLYTKIGKAISPYRAIGLAMKSDV